MAIEIVDFPIKNGDFPWQNVSSPEGNYPAVSSHRYGMIWNDMEWYGMIWNDMENPTTGSSLSFGKPMDFDTQKPSKIASHDVGMLTSTWQPDLQIRMSGLGPQSSSSLTIMGISHDWSNNGGSVTNQNHVFFMWGYALDTKKNSGWLKGKSPVETCWNMLKHVETCWNHSSLPSNIEVSCKFPEIVESLDEAKKSIWKSSKFLDNMIMVHPPKSSINPQQISPLFHAKPLSLWASEASTGSRWDRSWLVFWCHRDLPPPWWQNGCPEGRPNRELCFRSAALHPISGVGAKPTSGYGWNFCFRLRHEVSEPRTNGTMENE